MVKLSAYFARIKDILSFSTLNFSMPWYQSSNLLLKSRRKIPRSRCCWMFSFQDALTRMIGRALSSDWLLTHNGQSLKGKGSIFFILP